MKKELSVLDVAVLAREFKALEGSLVDTVVEEGKDIYIRLYSKAIGKPFLVISGAVIYLAHEKGAAAKSSGFGALLRKHIERAKLREVRQVGHERIIAFEFVEYTMYVELYSKGNILLCDKDSVIVGVRDRQEFKERILAPKEVYTVTPKESILGKPKADVLLALSEEVPVSKILGGSLGRQVAHEICVRAKVDPLKRVSASEAARVYASLMEVFSQTADPVMYFKDEKIDEVEPFPFVSIEAEREEKVSSFSEGVRRFVAQGIVVVDKEARKIAQLDERIALQKEKLLFLEAEIAGNQKAAELIYGNYPVVQEILAELQAARRKLSWDEIKKRLKGHKVVKSVDEKTGKIIVELE